MKLEKIASGNYRGRLGKAQRPFRSTWPDVQAVRTASLRSTDPSTSSSNSSAWRVTPRRWTPRRRISTRSWPSTCAARIVADGQAVAQGSDRGRKAGVAHQHLHQMGHVRGSRLARSYWARRNSPSRGSPRPWCLNLVPKGMGTNTVCPTFILTALHPGDLRRSRRSGAWLMEKIKPRQRWAAP